MFRTFLSVNNECAGQISAKANRQRIAEAVKSPFMQFFVGVHIQRTDISLFRVSRTLTENFKQIRRKTTIRRRIDQTSYAPDFVTQHFGDLKNVKFSRFQVVENK